MSHSGCEDRAPNQSPRQILIKTKSRASHIQSVASTRVRLTKTKTNKQKKGGSVLPCTVRRSKPLRSASKTWQPVRLRTKFTTPFFQRKQFKRFRPQRRRIVPAISSISSCSCGSTRSVDVGKVFGGRSCQHALKAERNQRRVQLLQHRRQCSHKLVVATSLQFVRVGLHAHRVQGGRFVDEIA